MIRPSKKLKRKQKSDKQSILLAEVKANRRKETVFTRKVPELEENPLYLIYCEGKNTEPSYFKKFKLSHLFSLLHNIFISNRNSQIQNKLYS